jgi:hypothetical protein
LLSLIVAAGTTWMTLVVMGCTAFFIRKKWRPPFPGGSCQSCGYDLTGLSVLRCPECGKSFSAQERATKSWTYVK